jgi:hypothetical protein
MNLSENDLLELGFEQRLMLGTGWLTISSMRDAEYYYIKGRITISCSHFWRWYLDDDQRNDIAVNSKEELIELLSKYQ